MKNLLSTFFVINATLSILCACAPIRSGTTDLPQKQANVSRKKFIEYGHDVPEPTFVRDNIRNMEKRPFDGVVMRIPKYMQMFDTKPWPEGALRQESEALAATKWQKFTDNFLFLNGTHIGMDDGPADWFNDNHWTTITENMRLFSRVVHEGRLKGICFDAEPYEEIGGNIWQYPGKYEGEIVSKLPAQARARGRQIMNAIQSESPVLRILNFHILARLLYQMGGNDQVWIEWKAPAPVPGEPYFHHRGHKYALLGEFFVGMLEVAGPGITFIDGNEHAYYYSGRAEFDRARKLIRDGALSLVPTELHTKYGQQVQVGVATYSNWVMGTWPREKTGLTPTHFMSRWEQFRYMESDIYNALATTDEYVWFYNEGMDWWRKPGEVARPGASGPEPAPLGGGRPYRVSPTLDGLEKAIISARTKFDTGQPLGYDLAPMIEAAREKQAVEMKSLSKTRDAKTAD